MLAPLSSCRPLSRYGPSTRNVHCADPDLSLLCTQERLPGSCPAAQAKPAQVHSELDALARMHAGLRRGKATLVSEVSFTERSISKDVTLDPDACSISPARTAAAVFWRSRPKHDPEDDEWEELVECQSVQMAHKWRNGRWRVTPSGCGEPRVEGWTQVTRGWSKSGRWFSVLCVEGLDWEGHCMRARVRLQPDWQTCVTGCCLKLRMQVARQRGC